MGECLGFPPLWEHASDSTAAKRQARTFLLTRDGGGADRMTGSVCPGVGALSRGVPAALNPTSALLPQTDVTASLGSLSSQVQGHGCSVLGHILEKAGPHASPCPSITDGTGSFVVFPVEKVSLICSVSYPSSSLKRHLGSSQWTATLNARRGRA